MGHRPGQMGRKGTETLRDASELVLPVKAENRTLAAVVVRSGGKELNLSSEQRRLIDSFANLAAIATIRVSLADDAGQAQRLAELERSHRALLDSVSQGLRTPLSSIMGAATGLLEEGGRYDQAAIRALLEIIKRGAFSLDRLVTNLLVMASIQRGMLKLNEQLCDVEDVIGVALNHVADVVEGREVSVQTPDGCPPVMADFGLFERVLINLLENAVKSSPTSTSISISARLVDNALLVTVIDQGPPLPVREREYVFERFYWSPSPEDKGGTALGLAVCKGIVETHGGIIWLEFPEGAGNRFTFSLPLSSRPSKGIE